MTTADGPVAPDNVAQADAWDGEGGAYWAARADEFDRSSRLYQPRFVAAVGARPGDDVLDVGCGAGQLSLDLARTAGSVTGIDLSSAMLAVARERAADRDIGNATFVRADAQVYPFTPSSYDLVVSRSGVMFFADPVAAFTNLGGALRPGGRLVLMTWQGLEHSEWLRLVVGALAAGRDLPGPPPDAAGPLGLSRPERVRDILGHAGFTDVALEDVSEPLDFGPTAEAASDFVLGLQGWMLDGLDADGRARATSDLHAAMAAHETPDGVLLGSRAWFVTATHP